MKICIITNLYYPYETGGAEKFTRSLAYALREAGHEITVITAKPFSGLRSLWPGVSKEEGMTVWRFYPLNLFFVGAARSKNIAVWAKMIWRLIDIFNAHTFFAVLSVLRQEKPDIVHASNLGGLSYSALWAAGLVGIPLVHTLHDYHLLCPVAGDMVCPWTEFRLCRSRLSVCKVYSMLKKLVVSSLPVCIVSPSRFAADFHKAFGFFRNADIRVIPNFIEAAPTQAMMDGGKKTFDILYAGRLLKNKGIDVLIRAFRGLEGSSLRLHIAGDGDERPELERLASADPRIVFHGFQGGEGMQKLYSLSDVVVVPSIWYENCPGVVLEAFAYGVPVIASRIGGIPELVIDGYNGFLFVPSDATELRAKIKTLSDDSNSQGHLRDSLGRNALETAGRMAPSDFVRRIETLYASCCAYQRRSRGSGLGS